MTFRVGQKVVCIRGSVFCQSMWSGVTNVEIGKVYTIRALLFLDDFPSQFGMGCWVEEIVNPFNPLSEIEPGFFTSRFRPLVERKTDIAIFNEILRKVSGKRRVEA